MDQCSSADQSRRLDDQRNRSVLLERNDVDARRSCHAIGEWQRNQHFSVIRSHHEALSNCRRPVAFPFCKRDGCASRPVPQVLRLPASSCSPSSRMGFGFPRPEYLHCRAVRHSACMSKRRAPFKSGIAISNPGSANTIVNFELSNLDGTPTGITGSTPVPATGQVAMFLNQIPGFSSLPASFKGVLRLTGSNIYVTGLRGRYNERGDFLITTTSPVDEMSPPSNSQFVLPQLADGGGYTTQIILF